MNEYLKKYDVTLITKGPVYIGSGKEIGKKEYVFCNNKKISILNIEKFYKYVCKIGKGYDFEKFMIMDYRSDLTRWCLDNKILLKDLQPYIKYDLNISDSVIEKGKTIQIFEFIKDPYGLPYVPGSSLKGMFRTIFLGAEIVQNIDKYQEAGNAVIKTVSQDKKVGRTALLSHNITSIEATKFRTLMRNEKKPGDAVNDIMSGFIVSDSEPIAIKKLILSQKVERHVDGLEKKLNILRECIAPSSPIRFSITIDSSICPFTKEDIWNAVKIFNTNYYENFVSSFQNIIKPDDNEVYLGGGVGFVSKTINYPLLGKENGISVIQNIFQKTGVPRQHKHYNDYKIGVSPHIIKCTKNEGTSIQMGICYIDDIS